MKKNIAIAGIMLLSGMQDSNAAVTLVTDPKFGTNLSLTTSNAPLAWSSPTGALTGSWAVTFNMTLTSSSIYTESPFFCTTAGSSGAAGLGLMLNAPAGSNPTGPVSLILADSSGRLIDSSIKINLGTASLMQPIVFIFRDSGTASFEVSVYSGATRLGAVYTTNTDRTLTNNAGTNSGSRFYTNGGIEQFSGLQVASFDGTADTDNVVLQTFGIATVPEPSSVAMGALGLSALLLRRRRRQA